MNKNTIVLLIFAMTFIVVSSLDIYIPIAPQLAKVFSVSDHMIKLTFLLGPLASGLIGIPVGHLSDLYGRRPLLLLSLFFFFTGMMMCAMSQSVAWFFFGRFLESLGVGGVLVLNSAILSDLFTGIKLARYMGLYALSFPVAFATAPIIGAQVFVWFGWRMIFWLLFISLIPIAWGIAFYMPETCKGGDKEPIIPRLQKVFTSKLALALAFTHAVPVTVGAIFTVNGSFLYYHLYQFDSLSFSFVQAVPVIFQCVGTLIYRSLVKVTGLRKTLQMGLWVAVLYSVICLFMIFEVLSGPWVTVFAVCLFSLGSTFVIISAATLLLDCSGSKGFTSSFLSLVKNVVISFVITGTSFLPNNSIVPIFSAMLFVSLTTICLVILSVRALEEQEMVSLNS